jgi:hypothetical protein
MRKRWRQHVQVADALCAPITYKMAPPVEPERRHLNDVPLRDGFLNFQVALGRFLSFSLSALFKGLPSLLRVPPRHDRDGHVRLRVRLRIDRWAAGAGDCRPDALMTRTAARGGSVRAAGRGTTGVRGARLALRGEVRCLWQCDLGPGAWVRHRNRAGGDQSIFASPAGDAPDTVASSNTCW